MSKIISSNAQVGVGRRERLKRKFVPLLTLLLVIVITVGLLYFYKNYPDMRDEFKSYGYLGAFLISLTFNATIIFPAGNILILSVLGATLPSATLVGLAGGAGAAIGELTGYMAGYSGRAIVAKGKMYVRLEYWVRRWGAITIFIFSLVPLFFDLAGIAAGVLRFPLWKFVLICWFGRSLLYVGIALVGAWGWKAVLPYLG